MVKGFEVGSREEIAAVKASEILGADIERRTSEKGTRVFYEAKRGEEDACLVQEQGSSNITSLSGEELALAFKKEFETRQRSRDFVNGKVEAKVFGGYVPPEVIANEDYVPPKHTDGENDHER